jgi:hypothetical protein
VFFMTDARQFMIFSFLEQLSWLIGVVLMAVMWDRGLATAILQAKQAGTPLPSPSWYMVAIPFVLAIIFRIRSSMLSINLYHDEQEKMVSPEYFKEQAGGVDLEDLEEEKLAELEELYTVITVEEDEVEAIADHLRSQGEEMDAEKLELLRVSLSPEYHELHEAIANQATSILTVTVFGFSFLFIVAAKLQDDIRVSWWVVFVPIWVFLSLKLVKAYFICCFAPVSGESFVIQEMGASVKVPNNAAEATEGGVEGAPDTKHEDSGVSTIIFGNPESTMSEFASSVQTASATDPANVAAPSATKNESIASGVNQTSTDNETGHAAVDDKLDVENGDMDPDKRQDDDGPETQDDEDGPRQGDPYRAWQAAHEQAEHSAMERQAKAQSMCCSTTFILILVCLVVGKLEKSYPNSDLSESSSTGYSAFWILFPVFVVMGIILCCCSCLIYCAGESSLDSLVEKAKHGDGDEEDDNEQTPTDEAAATTIAMPAPDASPAVEEQAVASSKTSAEKQPKDEEAGEDLNDLD